MYQSPSTSFWLEIAGLVAMLSFFLGLFKLCLWIDSQAYGLSWINGLGYYNLKELVGPALLPLHLSPEANPDCDLWSNKVSGDHLSTLDRWIAYARLLFKGPAVIHEHYTSGKPHVPSSTHNYVLVSSEAHIKEICQAQAAQGLSVSEAYSDIFGLKYVQKFYGGDAYLEPSRKFRSRILSRALVSNLPALFDGLSAKLEGTFAAQLKGRKSLDGWTAVPNFTTCDAVIKEMTGLVYFGDTLVNNPEFWSAACQYPRDLVLNGEMLQLLPFLKSFVKFGDVFVRKRNRNIVYKYLTPLIRGLRRDRESLQQAKVQPGLTVAHWMIEAAESNTFWTDELLVHNLVSSWFAGVGGSIAMSITQAVTDLCLHPEYIQPLRNEIEQLPSLDYHALANLPLLDSFLKECGRIHPWDSVFIRRKATKPYTFSGGGPHVPVGDVACVPIKAIMNDEANYPNATEFNGFRFAPVEVVTAAAANIAASKVPTDEKLVTKPEKLTDISTKYLYWGYGLDSCAGRVYASCIMKMILAHLLTKYDFKLANPSGPQTFSWRTYIIPRRSAILLLRERVN